jgi:hypothetical protein
MTKSKHRLNGPILHIARGVHVYRTFASPFWFARIWDRSTGKYRVRSTKETSRVAARAAAEELAAEMSSRRIETPREYTFKNFAARFLDKKRQLMESGALNPGYLRSAQFCLDSPDCGLMGSFADRDVRALRTKDYVEHMEGVHRRRPDLSSSTLNSITATWRNVMKVARDEGAIDSIPATPRAVRKRANPRPFFRFFPLVPKERDAYRKLLDSARQLAEEGPVIKGAPVTEELRDAILFLVHTFMRPTTTEFFALRHADVEVARDQPRRLLITIRRGKTGHRVASSMPGAVSILERIRKRHPDAKGEDFLFLPQYPNRSTASQILRAHFNAAMDRANVRHDPYTGKDHSLYSLRHLSLVMRFVLSKGRVNVYSLARNAGTSVTQLEAHYLKHLPMTSPELIANLQSMGD